MSGGGVWAMFNRESEVSGGGGQHGHGRPLRPDGIIVIMLNCLLHTVDF